MKIKIIQFLTLPFFYLLCINFSYAQTTSYEFLLPFSQYIPCANGGAGEVVSGDITIHATEHHSKNGNLIKVHFNPRAGIIKGEITGDIFRATGVESWNLTFNKNNPNHAHQYRARIHIVGKGGTQFKLYILFHHTFNANGELTTEFENVNIDCK